MKLSGMRRRQRTRIPSQQQIRLLQVLLDQEGLRHGYELMKATALGPATLYGLLKRLFDEGYVTRDTAVVAGRCRISYRLTEAGARYAERALSEDEYERGALAFQEVKP